jgi:DeoR family transcriptional regulator, suf operon transcriptional repressor
VEHSDAIRSAGGTTSDVLVLDLLRKKGPLSVSQLAIATGVTATAVRQRLARLIEQRFVERTVVRGGRGRPSHHYALTERGRRQTGANFADLAIALWAEVRQIKDPEIRRGLLLRLARRLANVYADRIQGTTLAERMQSLQEIFAERNISFTVGQSGGLPVLTADTCPYPDLAEHDPAICAMERLLFSELLGENLKLTECRVHGAACCTFETN